MQYLLMIYSPEAANLQEAANPAVMSDITSRHTTLAQDLVAAGVMRGGERLRPSTEATTATWANGTHTLHDGPYAETREQLGGFYMIDVPDLDEALKWARQIPLQDGGAIEVRPIWPMS